MTLTSFCIVLFAAILHAGWNLFIKSANDKFSSMSLLCAGSVLVCALVLPWLPQPAPASWPYLAASVACQLIYYGLLIAAYRYADMSQAYPVMRGTAPLWVVLFGLAVFHQELSSRQIFAICLLAAGICLMANFQQIRRQPELRKGLAFALLNAVFIASYTVIDGIGVRLAVTSASYTLWIFLLSSALFCCFSFWRKPQQILVLYRQHWPDGLKAGAASITSYGLALWAMQSAPVAMVAALRESSIIFAALFAYFYLGELIDRRRMLAIALALAGVLLLRLT